MARIRARSISKQGSAEIVRNQSNLGPAVHELDARRGIVADDTAAAALVLLSGRSPITSSSSASVPLEHGALRPA